MALFPTPDLLSEFRSRVRGGRVVDLGCGDRKSDDAFGVDLVHSPHVDLVHDLNIAPWPLETEEFDALILNHVIEHLADISATIGECARLLKPGGRLWIATPHFSDVSSWADPTHRHHLALRSFEPFYAGPGTQFRLERAYQRLNGRWRNIGYEKWINRGHKEDRLSRAARRWEDKHCFVRRGGEMCFVLVRR